MNNEEQIEQFNQYIKKLKKERDNTPFRHFQRIESITSDINYYQKQIDTLMNERVE